MRRNLYTLDNCFAGENCLPTTKFKTSHRVQFYQKFVYYFTGRLDTELAFTVILLEELMGINISRN